MAKPKPKPRKKRTLPKHQFMVPGKRKLSSSDKPAMTATREAQTKSRPKLAKWQY